MKRIKSLKFIIAAVAVGLILTAGVGSTLAYFSTYAESEGGIMINFNRKEEIHEDVDGMMKHITIYSEEGSQPVFVRARAFVGSDYLPYYSIGGEGWTDGGDGWFYYSEALKGGETTSVLNAGLSDVPEKEFKGGDQINIAVVYESTLAIYKYNDGTGSYEAYADWSQILEGGNE